MNWTPYKNSRGEYAEYQGLVLAAWPTGAWAVHSPTGKVKPRSSNLIIRHKDLSLETAKREAEQAAIEMTT
jgi:hypothetical protein